VVSDLEAGSMVSNADVYNPQVPNQMRPQCTGKTPWRQGGRVGVRGWRGGGNWFLSVCICGDYEKRKLPARDPVKKAAESSRNEHGYPRISYGLGVVSGLLSRKIIEVGFGKVLCLYRCGRFEEDEGDVVNDVIRFDGEYRGRMAGMKPLAS
jgi:hypothetical protein